MNAEEYWINMDEDEVRRLANEYDYTFADIDPLPFHKLDERIQEELEERARARMEAK